MDTTKEYIKMCDCEEIQKQRVKSNGDFEVRFKNGVGTVEVYHHREITAHYKPENHLWLPRQDQLQGMVFGPGQFLEGVLACGQTQYLLDFVNSAYSMVAASMEQLWLGFVMSVKYDKVWKDSQWIVKSAV